MSDNPYDRPPYHHVITARDTVRALTGTDPARRELARSDTRLFAKLAKTGGFIGRTSRQVLENMRFLLQTRRKIHRP